MKNEFKMQVLSKSTNESFSRVAVSAFVSSLDPSIEEIADIKTIVSEAVTNCIVHAYREQIGVIYINVKLLDNRKVIIKIRDRGCGIPDIKQAMEPLFTTGGSERAGLGFAVMQSFSDRVRVSSTVGKGTTVTFYKTLSDDKALSDK